MAMPRVLVVEDEYLIRMLLEDMLADLGYEIAGAVGSIAEAKQLAADGAFEVGLHAFGVAAQFLDQRRDHAVFLRQQREQQMFGLKRLVVEARCDRNRILHRFLGFGGEFIESHCVLQQKGVRHNFGRGPEIEPDP